MINIKNKLNDYKDSIIGNGLYDLSKNICLLILSGTCSSTLTNICLYFLDIEVLNMYRISITIIIILFIIILFLEILQKKHTNGDYTILKKEIFFTYGKDNSKYEQLLEVKSNINGLNRLKGKYAWTGSDEPTIKCETQHCNIFFLTRKDFYIEYEIELNRNYNKGEEFSCKIVGDMPDPDHKFIPFFSTQVTEKTYELIINICIPPANNVKNVSSEEISTDGNQKGNNYSEHTLDVDGKYQWIINRPKLFYKYSLRWY